MAFSMEKWFSTDYSATVGRILMIFSADPLKFRFRWNVTKSNPLARLSGCAQNSHYAYSGFWPIFAYFGPIVLRFLWGKFFPFIRKGIWANILAGEILIFQALITSMNNGPRQIPSPSSSVFPVFQMQQCIFPSLPLLLWPSVHS